MTPASPVAVRVSAWLYVCSFVPGLVSLAVNPKLGSLAHAQPVAFAVAIAILSVPIGLFGVVSYLAFHRRNWARWVLVVIVVGATLIQLPRDPVFRSILKGSVSWTALLFALITVAQIASVVLLFLPDSDRWYRDDSRVADVERA